MRRRVNNFDYLSQYTYYVPGVADMFILLAFLLLGAILGNVITLIFSAFLSVEAATEYGMIVAYPVMFIPAMLYASAKSRSNSFNKEGVKVDSDNFSPLGIVLCCVFVMVATLAASFCSEAPSSLLPEMPEWIENMLSSLTEGTFWVNFLCVSIFAPVFEEWLCRGMVLRGLLHNKVRPVWAIVISALFFAAIHLNPWQALPAFILGCLFGYVYYKTGSLRLTMLMHFTNNTFALCISQIDSLSEYDSFMQILPDTLYWIIWTALILLIILIVNKFRTIPLKATEGNSDKVPSLFDSPNE